MPEYTYLLETRLSSAQQHTLAQVRQAAREAGMTVFLAGGAVRDLTTGSSVRDLDFSVQGNALLLEEALKARGGELWGKEEATRTLFFFFPGSVRVEVASTRKESFPKPGKPVYEWSSMVEDLHRRDFTANAMALSLNEGSYGLLLDPLNGVADIEARQLRLVSNYGFLEDPSRLVRLVRLRQRLGWTVEDRTQTRYDNAKEADNFDVISAFQRGYELEEIAAEEGAPAVLRSLAAEGWMEKLAPEWTVESIDGSALDELHRVRIQLLMQGIAPDLTAAHLQMMTARMKPAAREKLKAAMVRPGLRAQWEKLDESAKAFAQLLTGKDAAAPSATWKLFHTHAAEPILWLAQGKRTPAAESKFKNLFTVWPEAAKKVPIALMLELRITPELPGYEALLHELFLAQIDGKLETDEALRAFLEPYSPPAPPPPVSLKRTRAKKGAKRKGSARDEDEDETEKEPEEADEEDEAAGGPPELDLSRSLGKVDLGAVLGRIQSDADTEPEDEAPESLPAPVKEDEDEDMDEDLSEDQDEEPAPKAPAKAAARKAAPPKAAPVSLREPAPSADEQAPALVKAPVKAVAPKVPPAPVTSVAPGKPAAPKPPVSRKATAPEKVAKEKAAPEKTAPEKRPEPVAVKPVAEKKATPAKQAAPAVKEAAAEEPAAKAASQTAKPEPARKAEAAGKPESGKKSAPAKKPEPAPAKKAAPKKK